MLNPVCVWKSSNVKQGLMLKYNNAELPQ